MGNTTQEWIRKREVIGVVVEGWNRGGEGE